MTAGMTFVMVIIVLLHSSLKSAKKCKKKFREKLPNGATRKCLIKRVDFSLRFNRCNHSKNKSILFCELFPKFLREINFTNFFPKFRALCRREQGHIPGSRCCGGGELLLSLGLGGVGGLWGYSA